MFLESLASTRPVVLAVEDLHWADEAMLAFMDYLAQSGSDVPLLVLASARPEVTEVVGPGAGFVAAAAHIPLGPLSGEETAELARARLGAKSLPTDLQALILERSGGNPFFAEELVRLLQDRALLETHGGKVALKPGAEVPLPDSIGALIAARLELLSPERKALLADAAVVGRSFWAGAVAAVGPHEVAEVFEGFYDLVAKELVRPERDSSIEGETEFAFVHALVSEVAYSQLTLADRAAKHAALARWLEEHAAVRNEDLAEVLAYHYGTALESAGAAGLFELADELEEPTTRYLELAGGRAAPLDSAAAAAHFARAERIAQEAAKPKRRFLLSRRTRRTLKRRAPLLVAAAAVIVVALAVSLAVYQFRPREDSPGSVRLTPAQIADKYGTGLVRITARVPVSVNGRLRWEKRVGVGFVASKDGLIITSNGVVDDTSPSRSHGADLLQRLSPVGDVRVLGAAGAAHPGEGPRGLRGPGHLRLRVHRRRPEQGPAQADPHRRRHRGARRHAGRRAAVPGLDAARHTSRQRHGPDRRLARRRPDRQDGRRHAHGRPARLHPTSAHRCSTPSPAK